MDIIDILLLEIGSEKVLIGDAISERYSHIWTMNEPLKAKVYLLPKSTEDISKICKICYAYDQPMLVFGGLTNLVGATETTGDEVIISMERMNYIEDVDVQNRTMKVQAGALLEEVQERAKENDLFFPLSFGAKGSAQIGGCISTNAGGIRVLRYGMTRHQILGLEVVLPNGKIMSSLKEMIKDNSGYDLKQLFIGAEGTLGIVTKAVLKLQEIPQSRNSVFVAMNDFKSVITFLKFMEKKLGGQLSAFELLDNSSYKTLTAEGTPWRQPLPPNYQYYIIAESLGGSENRDRLYLEEILEQAMHEELFEDGVMAHSESDVNWFWDIREGVEFIAQECVIDQHFDVSLPINKMEHYIKSVKENLSRIAEVKHCFVFGHVADGNMHFVIGKTSEALYLKEKINDIVYHSLKELGGSVSAEHGIGLHKKKYLPLCRQENEIDLMRLIKKSMDPKNLLNAQRIFDTFIPQNANYSEQD